MKRFGLLGRKLSHSYSPQIHKKLGEYEYLLYEKEPKDLNEFFSNYKLDGMNVTIPYKKDVIKYCSKLSETVEKIGSVNTIVKENDGTLSGYNTDYYGFNFMIEKSKIEVENKKVLVLGSGGASLTVCTVLKDLKAREVVVISRSGENNYTNLDKHYDADVIVNTTPVGMYPKIDACPIDLVSFKNCSGVLDLIYNPDKTLLLKQANKLGIKNINGLTMLVAQAKLSSELFLNTKLDDKIVEKIISGGVI